MLVALWNPLELSLEDRALCYRLLECKPCPKLSPLFGDSVSRDDLIYPVLRATEGFDEKEEEWLFKFLEGKEQKKKEYNASSKL